MSKQTGVVKWFNNQKGYGFISGQEGHDVFVHFSNIKEQGPDKDLHEGEDVTFDEIQAERGPSAINVMKMK